jgi:hypothetical protein
MAQEELGGTVLEREGCCPGVHEICDRRGFRHGNPSREGSAPRARGRDDDSAPPAEHRNPLDRPSVADQRVHVVPVESVATVQEAQLDDEQGADDDTAEALDEVDLRPGGPPRREHVVEHDHS